MIDYVRGKRSYTHDKDWIREKRILAVMNLDLKHFVALEMLLEDGKMKVYDCNSSVYEEANSFTMMQPLLDLFPRLLKQSGLMNHFPSKVLNEKLTLKVAARIRTLKEI
ncbi:hypothetical protein FXO38_01773 [Capsicum annuum]|nr:hypothetical protein FXO38_01773 [Capsicum annuum]